MHIVDKGVSFSKLARKCQNGKVGKMTFGALWLHSGPLCDAVVQKYKDSFSFIFIVSKPILLKQNLETSKNKPDTLVLIAIFV